MPQSQRKIDRDPLKKNFLNEQKHKLFNDTRIKPQKEPHETFKKRIICTLQRTNSYQNIKHKS